MDRIVHATAKGSTVSPIKTSSWEIFFDWFEEGACIDATPQVDTRDQSLMWSCPCCEDTGRAELRWAE